MDPKRPHPEDHRRYIQVLRSMTPQQRLERAFELSEMTKQEFRQRLRERFPFLNEKQFHQLFLERWIKRDRVDW